MDRRIESLRPWLFVAAALLVALIAAWPAISQPGLLNTRAGGDSPFLLQRLHQLETALRDGHFPARWMPDANYGYGYPFYNYYAPLSIYIAAVFRFLGFSFVRAIHLAHLAGFLVAAAGMYVLGRRWLGSAWAGLLASVAYTTAPFHMVNVYVRGDSLAEFWAMAFYPLVLLAADGLLAAVRGGRRDQARALALFALAYGGLILCHNISALIFTPFLLLYLILRVLWPNEPQANATSSPVDDSPAAPVLYLLAALGLALALAVWFFVPALAEQDLVQLGPVTEGYFHYSNHFRGLDLVQTSLRFDYEPDGGNAFRMGLVQAALAVAGLLVMVHALWRGRSLTTRSRAFFIILSALLATFMISPLSRFLWDSLPLLPFTQFPWRLLSVQALFASLLIGALAWLPWRQALTPALGVILLGAALGGLKTDHLILTDADVTAERLAQYEWFTGNIGTTVSAEYLPQTMRLRPYSSAWLNNGERDRPSALAGSLTGAVLLERTATRQHWRLTADGDGATAMFPTLAFPGWRATLDGQPVRPGVAASGLIQLDVPPGQHEVAFHLARTPVRLVAELASLAALAAVAALLVYGGRSQATLRLLAELAGALVLLLVLAAMLRRLDPQSLSPDDLTWDFGQLGYLHHEPGGIAFEGGETLFHYGYSHDAIAAGDVLTVTLSLSAPAGAPVTFDLATPALARPWPPGTADPPVLTGETELVDGKAATFRLEIPREAPAGLYIPRLTIRDSSALTPSGLTRGDLYLRPLQITPASELPSSAGRVSDAASFPGLDVETIAITQRDAQTLDGRFAWLTAGAPDRHYQFSWRLQDSQGRVLAQLDQQPGYGFQPSVGWAAGMPNFDWPALRLPDELSAAPPYYLMMLLYDPASGEEVLARRLGELAMVDGEFAFQPHQPAFDAPIGLRPLAATFDTNGGPLIEAVGYTSSLEGSELVLTLYWRALAESSISYQRFVHLIDPAGGTIVAQLDGLPDGGYPTDQWERGEIVADRLVLDLAAVAPGEYQLAVGFYLPQGDLPRLTVITPAGAGSDGRLLLPETVQWSGP